MRISRHRRPLQVLAPPSFSFFCLGSKTHWVSQRKKKNTPAISPSFWFGRIVVVGPLLPVLNIPTSRDIAVSRLRYHIIENFITLRSAATGARLGKDMSVNECLNMTKTSRFIKAGCAKSPVSFWHQQVLRGCCSFDLQKHMVEGWMQAGGVLQHLKSYDNSPTLCDNHITKNTWIGPVLLRTPAKNVHPNSLPLIGFFILWEFHLNFITYHNMLPPSSHLSHGSKSKPFRKRGLRQLLVSFSIWKLLLSKKWLQAPGRQQTWWSVVLMRMVTLITWLHDQGHNTVKRQHPSYGQRQAPKGLIKTWHWRTKAVLGLFRTSTVITTITVTVAPTDLTITVTVTLVQKNTGLRATKNPHQRHLAEAVIWWCDDGGDWFS